MECIEHMRAKEREKKRIKKKISNRQTNREIVKNFLLSTETKAKEIRFSLSLLDSFYFLVVHLFAKTFKSMMHTYSVRDSRATTTTKKTATILCARIWSCEMNENETTGNKNNKDRYIIATKLTALFETLLSCEIKCVRIEKNQCFTIKSPYVVKFANNMQRIGKWAPF